MGNEKILEVREIYNELKQKRKNLEALKRKIKKLEKNATVKRYLELKKLSHLPVDSIEIMEMAFQNANLGNENEIYLKYGYVNNNGFTPYIDFANGVIYRGLSSKDNVEIISYSHNSVRFDDDKDFINENYVIIPESIYLYEEESYNLYIQLQKWYWEELLTKDDSTEVVLETIKSKIKTHYYNLRIK